MKKILTVHWYLAGIFLLALFFRLYKLGSLPFNFHEDEILTGYVGRYILLNGKDLYGNPWPLLYFNKFGDYYIILPMYIKGFFTFIFGVNEFAVRFPVALLGALAVIPVYYLANWIFNNKTIALVSAFVLAITPWHIVLSRASSEGVMGTTIFLFAIMMLLKSFENKKLSLFFGASALFFITYFIYHPFRILTPLALFGAAVLLGDIKNKRNLTTAVIALFIISIIGTGYIGTTQWGSGRFSQTSLFSPLSGVQIKIQELIYDEGQNNILTAKIFHNKVIGFSREFLYQYTSYFSPAFLFINGGKSLAYRVPEQGVLYITFMGIFAAAVFFLSKKNYMLKERRHILFFIYLLLISPLPAGLTIIDSPNVHRSILMAPLIAIIVGYGLYKLHSLKLNRFHLSYIFALCIFIEGIYFWHQYSRHADFFNAIYRNDGQREVIRYLTTTIDPQTPVIIPIQNTMPLYYLFYTNDFDPSYSSRIKLDIRIDKIKNITFFEDECPSKKLLKTKLAPNVVIVDSHNCETNLDRYDLIQKVVGKNPLLAYKILKLKANRVQ